MPVPRSVTRVSRDGSVTFTSNVDRVQYTINELCRAAMRDVAKFLRKIMIAKLKKLPGMKRNRRIYNLQYWVRKQEADLVIGFKHGDTWYSTQQELGTKNQPKRGILRNTIYENIDQIRIIQGKYLSSISEENLAIGLINEDEQTSNPEGDDV